MTGVVLYCYIMPFDVVVELGEGLATYDFKETKVTPEEEALYGPAPIPVSPQTVTTGINPIGSRANSTMAPPSTSHSSRGSEPGECMASVYREQHIGVDYNSVVQFVGQMLGYSHWSVY